MIQRIADRALELFAPRATAAADQGYWETYCDYVPTGCAVGPNPGDISFYMRRRRYCRESWCTSWQYTCGC